MSLENGNADIESNESLDAEQKLRALTEDILNKLNDASDQNEIKNVFATAKRQAGEIQQTNLDQEEVVRIELPFNEGESIELTDLESKVMNLYSAMRGEDAQEIAAFSEGVPAEVVEILQDIATKENKALEAHWESE